MLKFERDFSYINFWFLFRLERKMYFVYVFDGFKYLYRKYKIYFFLNFIENISIVKLLILLKII